MKTTFFLALAIFSASTFAQSIHHVVLEMNRSRMALDCVVKKAVAVTNVKGDAFLVKVLLRPDYSYPVVKNVALIFKTENPETLVRKVFYIYFNSTDKDGWKATNNGFYTPSMSIMAALREVNAAVNLSVLNISSCNF